MTCTVDTAYVQYAGLMLGAIRWKNLPSEKEWIAGKAGSHIPVQDTCINAHLAKFKIKTSVHCRLGVFVLSDIFTLAMPKLRC